MTTEPSGDRLGASVMRALRTEAPEAEFFGMPGPRMREAGCESLEPMESVAVMGIIEVLKRYRSLARLRARLVEDIRARSPDVVVGIDAPDFNLGALKRFGHAGIPRVQLVSPQVWAWRRGRVRSVAASCDLLLSIFPFEAALYDGQPLDVKFIGHPVADEFPLTPDRAAARARLGCANPEKRLLAVLPGSRNQEITHLAAPFFESAALLAASHANLEVLCPCVSQAHQARLEEICALAAPKLRVRFLEGLGREVLAAADVALVASGTATLESMLARTPMVVGYRMPRFNFAIVRRLVRVPFIAMPNLLAGHELVPEFIQDAVQPAMLAKALDAWLCDADRRGAFAAEAATLHATLCRDASVTAAQAILGVIAQSRPEATSGVSPWTMTDATSEDAPSPSSGEPTHSCRK